MEAARAASPQMWGPEKVAESPRSLLASQGPRGPPWEQLALLRASQEDAAVPASHTSSAVVGLQTSCTHAASLSRKSGCIRITRNAVRPQIATFHPRSLTQWVWEGPENSHFSQAPRRSCCFCPGSALESHCSGPAVLSLGFML